MNSSERRKLKRSTGTDGVASSRPGTTPRGDKSNTESRLPDQTPTGTYRVLSWAWKALLAAVALVGFAYQFRPEIAVDKDVSLNPSDPFSTQFQITNKGRLSVYDLQFSCVLNSEQFRGFYSGNNLGQEKVPVLASNSSVTKNCSIQASGFQEKSELFFDVTYRPKWFWGRLQKRTRFTNVRDSTGRVLWIKQDDSSD